MPELLLLDESSMGLAPIVVESIAERTETIKDELGISILLVSLHPCERSDCQRRKH
ncbi:hypothetical protein [Archaeoglobus sp.]